jgi:glycosyltransferase involved in cell wall biosynthesis
MVTPSKIALPVSILMPVCNEVDVIAGVVDEWLDDVFQFLPPHSELVFEDCSEDGTTQILQQYAERYPFIRVHWHPKDGFFNAARRAYRHARCPLLFFTDSDGQYIAREFWKLTPLIEHVDMAHGVKRNRCDPAYRLLASGCFNHLARRLTGIEGRDINSAFRLVHRRLVEELLGAVHCMPTLLNAELYIRAKRAGYRIVDVDVSHRKRPHGASRGLPLGSFVASCRRAYQGLRELRAELATPIEQGNLDYPASARTALSTREPVIGKLSCRS